MFKGYFSPDTSFVILSPDIHESKVVETLRIIGTLPAAVK